MIGAWEYLGADTGGTVAGLAVAWSGSEQVVFAATPVGVFRSIDGGRTWNLPHWESTVPLAESVAVSPEFGRDRMVFACAHDGLYRSSDGGERWYPVLVGSRVQCAATLAGGLIIAGTETDGLLRSEDSGRSWTGANAGLLDLNITWLAFGKGVAFASTPSGLYRSRNAARSWRAVETGLRDPAVQCVAISPTVAEDGLVLAGTEADGLLRSSDAGTTWQTVTSLECVGVTAVAFSSEHPGHVAVATESGIAISDNNGATWQLATNTNAPVLALASIDQNDTVALLAGFYRHGVARSDDAGDSWQPVNTQLSGRLVVGVALSPTFAWDHTIYTAALEDGVRMSTDAGQSWIDCTPNLTDVAVSAVAVSSPMRAERMVYAATDRGLYITRNSGHSWMRSPELTQPLRAVVTSTDPASRTIVVAAEGGRLLRSGDGGQTWCSLGALEGNDVMTLTLSPGEAHDRTLFAATTSPAEGTRLWRSVNAGEQWQAVGNPLPSSWVTGLALSARFPEDQTMYLATSGGVLISVDAGRSFRPGPAEPTSGHVVAIAVPRQSQGDQFVYAVARGGTLWRCRTNV